MTGWTDARSVLIAHAGGREGHAALGPTLRALAAWSERRGARLVGLWSAPPPLAGRVTHRDLALPPDLRIELGGEEPWGAMVLSDPGHTALGIAYALALAGVPRRAGLASEFGGAVLTDPVPEPRGGPPEARHLALLAALGLAAEPSYGTAPPRDPPLCEGR